MFSNSLLDAEKSGVDVVETLQQVQESRSQNAMQLYDADTRLDYLESYEFGVLAFKLKLWVCLRR